MGASRFYAALAALLFTAACAWFGAAVFRSLTVSPVPAVESPVPTAASGRFRGVAVRREQALPMGTSLYATAGERLSAAETGTESALFFPDADGLEYLDPEALPDLTPEALDRLLLSEPERSADAGRLVYGRELYIAAFWEGDQVPAPGRCTLEFDGGASLRAALLSVSADGDGRTALLLRLPLGEGAPLTERFVEGTILF